MFEPNTVTLCVPQPVAKISICDAVTFTITDIMEFTRPTEEQIKNLRDTFCINVELIENKGD